MNQQSPKRTAVYIDGYNLYYGRIRGTAFKWLNIVSLFESIIHAQDNATTVDKVHFFSAPALATFASHGQASTIAQDNYHRALKTLYGEKFSLTLGTHRFDKKGTQLPTFIDGAPFDKGVRTRVWLLEEKKTDVNLAISAYRDASKGLVDQVVFVTNDSDAEPAMMAIRDDFPHIVIGAIMPIRPAKEDTNRRASASLQAIANWTRRHILDSEISEHQLPSMIPTAKKPIKKPNHW